MFWERSGQPRSSPSRRIRRREIDELIEGEAALNSRRPISGRKSSGLRRSFYIRSNACVSHLHQIRNRNDGEPKTDEEESYESVKSQVQSSLSRSFHETALALLVAQNCGAKDEHPTLNLLYWLSQSKSWGLFDSATKVGHVAWDREADFNAQFTSTTKLLLQKPVEVRAKKKADVERARASVA